MMFLVINVKYNLLQRLIALNTSKWQSHQNAINVIFSSN